MVSPGALSKLICLVGPTASGKTGLAVALAKVINGEIINADSRQFYREMSIGTAKPDPQTLREVTHHLVDCTGFENVWNVADFVTNAQQKIKEITLRGKTSLLSGGTGMYVQSLVYGLDEIPVVPDELRRVLTDRLNNEGLQSLYEELCRLDPPAAQQFKSGDTQRILRALEIFYHTGKPLREFWNKAAVPKYDVLFLALDWDRKILYERINTRVGEMIRSGLKAEAYSLWQKFPNHPLLKKTIGYAEWFEDAQRLDAAIAEAIRLNSRRFAKRQLTWFRNRKGVNWIPGGDAAFPAALKMIQEWQHEF